jgi:hypothetical protein
MTDYPVDLHMHTYYSDGWQSPDSVVRNAAMIGLKTIAITDHDNVRGSLEAEPVAEEVGIRLIPAIEVTTAWAYGGELRDVDILGYFIDRTHPDLLALCRRSEEDLRNRLAECCERITQAGHPITLRDALNVNARFASAGALIQALANKGYAGNFHEAAPLFYKQWIKGRKSHVRAEQAISAVRKAGGVPVLAHPARIGFHRLTAQQLQPLAEAGLGGIEVYHPTADDELNAHLLDLAQRMGLAVTGGSDDHGFNGFRRMGSQPVTQKMVDDLHTYVEG